MINLGRHLKFLVSIIAVPLLACKSTGCGTRDLDTNAAARECQQGTYRTEHALLRTRIATAISRNLLARSPLSRDALDGHREAISAEAHRVARRRDWVIQLRESGHATLILARPGGSTSPPLPGQDSPYVLRLQGTWRSEAGEFQVTFARPFDAYALLVLSPAGCREKRDSQKGSRTTTLSGMCFAQRLEVQVVEEIHFVDAGFDSLREQGALPPHPHRILVNVPLSRE